MLAGRRSPVGLDFLTLSGDSLHGVGMAGTTGETKACKGWTQASFCTKPSPATVLGLETEE